jgi:hypothetical protein
LNERESDHEKKKKKLNKKKVKKMSSGASSSGANGAIDYKWVTKGVELIWNNQFDDAEKHFAATKDTSPRAALHYAEVKKKNFFFFFFFFL